LEGKSILIKGFRKPEAVRVEHWVTKLFSNEKGIVTSQRPLYIEYPGRKMGKLDGIQDTG